MRLIVISLAAAGFTLAACSPAQTPTDAAPALPASAEAPPPSKSPTPPPPGQRPPMRVEDACGAEPRQVWVGKDRGEVPAAPAGENWRVYETGDILTQDLRPDRLNIEINPDTDKIVAVRCG